MASLGTWLGGGGRNRREPWLGNMDVLDPFGFGGGLNRGDDETSALAHAHVDWRETDDAHIFRADLPGVRKEEVKVQIEDNNVLQISGERTKEQEDASDKWHRVERSRGSFTRRFRLPENVNMDDIKCSLDHGVLTVTVPKRETSTKNVRYIDVA